MSYERPMPAVKVELLKVVHKGSLRAFATINIAGKLRINSIRIVQQDGQAAWVSLPQSEVASKDGGKSKYYPIVEAVDEKLKKQITDAVLAAYHAQQSNDSAGSGW
jgi:DNA-binding cell septation regulator SpoVG